MITFKSIPSIDGRGETCLSIREPGEWFNSREFIVFIGGGGIGGCKTKRAAIKLLQVEAENYCQRRIDEATRQLEHYTEQMMLLKTSGLSRTKLKKDAR
jgi:hypothetical protein